MDQRLELAFDFVKYQNTLRNQLDLLHAWLDESLQYAENGGLFKITPELMTFVKVFVDDNRESAVLLDLHQRPIKISNLSKFLKDIIKIYFETMNQYHAEYQKLHKSRNIRDLVEWNGES